MADMANMASSAAINSFQQQIQQQQQMNSIRNQQLLAQAQMRQENEAVQRQIAQMQNGFSGPRFQDSFQSSAFGNNFNNFNNGGAGWRNDLSQWQRPERTVVGGNYSGDRGRDNVLVFDFNGDGRYDESDVQSTTNMLKAVGGQVDLNGDGIVDMREAMQANELRQRYAQMDFNRDGVLSANEMHQNGARIWTDHSRGGLISQDELSSVYNMPNPNGFGTRRLDAVDFFNSRALTNSNSFNYGRPPGYDTYGPTYPSYF